MHRRRKLLAVAARAVAAILTLSVAVAGMPAAAQEIRDGASAAPSALRQSIDHAVEVAGTAPQDSVARAALSTDERADVAKRAGRLQADPVTGQSSGGGKTRIILALLGAAVSIGTTYYFIQYMKKQQEREQAGFRP